MNSFAWMIRRYTSVSVELSAEQLKQLETRCNEIVNSQQRRFWLILLATVVSCVAVSTLAAHLLGPLVASWTGWPNAWCRGGCGIVASLIAVAIWLRVYSIFYVRPLRRALTEFGYPVCERCGYSLRELGPESVNCPECGAAREGSSSP